jgi:hypothetical protein
MSAINIADIPRRLTLVFGLQVIVCVYDVLGVAAFIKMRESAAEGTFLPIADLSLFMKHFGWLLMSLPLAWYWFFVRKWVEEGADYSFLGKTVISGVAALLLLFSLGVIGSLGAMRCPLIQAIAETSRH